MQDALGSRGNLRGSGRQAWWEQKGEVPPGSHRRIGLSCLDNSVSWEGDGPHRLRTRWGAADLAYEFDMRTLGRDPELSEKTTGSLQAMGRNVGSSLDMALSN